MIGIHGNTLLRVILFSAISLPSFSNPIAHRIVGLDNAAQVHRKIADNTYIQAGAFASKANAAAYQQKLAGKLNVPVLIKQSGAYYRVLIGPLNSADQVRTVARKALGGPVHQPVSPVKIEKPKPFVKPVEKSSIKVSQKAVMVDKDGLSLQPAHGLFASIDGGIYAGRKTSAMTVNNGSDFPDPANRDIYTGGNSNTPGTLGFTVGWFGKTHYDWLPGYSLGMRYKHLFSNNINGVVIQYSTDDYTNYSYQWRTTSNVVLAQGKLNFIPFSRFLPYVSGGLGAAFNRSNSYSETAFPGITPRISPAFGGRTQAQFAWTVGAGLDYRLYPEIVLSAGYEFQNFGRMQSGPGTVEWVTERLAQPGLQTNGALFSVTWELEK